MSRPEVSRLPDSVFVDDRGGPVPLYHDLALKIEGAIRAGHIPPGGRLEDESSLSLRLGVSRPTVRRAIQELVDKGLLVRRRGIGTQVVPPAALSRKFELSSLWEDLTRLGRNPTTEIIRFARIRLPEEEAKALGAEVGSFGLHVRRLRSAESTPLAILDNYLPPWVADVTESELAERGLYDLLGRRGITIRVAHQSITARRATAEEASHLGLTPRSPLLIMQRTAFDASGTAVETGTHVYRPDMYSFEATLVRS